MSGLKDFCKSAFDEWSAEMTSAGHTPGRADEAAFGVGFYNGWGYAVEAVKWLAKKEGRPDPIARAD